MGALRGCRLGLGLAGSAAWAQGLLLHPGGWVVELGGRLWGLQQVSCPQGHPCPALAALDVEGMQGHGSPSLDPQTLEPLSLCRAGWKPTVPGLSREGPLGTGVGVWREHRPTPVAVHSPAGERPQGSVPAERPSQTTRMPAQLGALQRFPGGHGKPLPDAPGRGGGGAGQPARLGRSCVGFPGLGTPPPRLQSWACGVDRGGGSGQFRTGTAPPPRPSSHPRSSFSPPTSSPRPPSAFLGERAQLRRRCLGVVDETPHTLPHWTDHRGIPQKSVARTLGRTERVRGGRHPREGRSPEPQASCGSP